MKYPKATASGGFASPRNTLLGWERDGYPAPSWWPKKDVGVDDPKPVMVDVGPTVWVIRCKTMMEGQPVTIEVDRAR